ncbi:MAG TPA: UPF0158 family protein [Actinoplanes sp.]|jgi:hypothetical protein
MLELAELDLEEIGGALGDQTDYERLWLIDPGTGKLDFWTSDLGIDGQNPVEVDELVEERGLVVIEPLPSRVWYRDMADFAEGVSDAAAARRLARAIQGKGAFRHFKDELHQEYPELVPVWNAFRDARAKRRAVEWLAEHSIVSEDAAARYRDDNPDVELP